MHAVRYTHHGSTAVSRLGKIRIYEMGGTTPGTLSELPHAEFSDLARSEQMTLLFLS